MPTKRNYQGNQQNYDASNGEYETGPETAFSSFSNPKKDESKVAQMGSDNLKSVRGEISKLSNQPNGLSTKEFEERHDLKQQYNKLLGKDIYNGNTDHDIGVQGVLDEYSSKENDLNEPQAKQKYLQDLSNSKDALKEMISKTDDEDEIEQYEGRIDAIDMISEHLSNDKPAQLGSDNNATMSGEKLFQDFHGYTRKPSSKKELLKNGEMFKDKKFTNKELSYNEEIDDETFKRITERPLTDDIYFKKLNKLDIDPYKSLVALTSPNSDKALLVDTQGYDYIRYGALIDKSQIDFKEEGEISTKLNDEADIHNRLFNLFDKGDNLTTDEFKEKRALKNKYNKLLNKELYKGNKYYDASVNSILNDFIYRTEDLSDPKTRDDYLKDLDFWLDEAKEDYTTASKYNDFDGREEQQGIIDTVEYVKDRIKNYKK